ncbi:MAG: methionine adenosyltransferase [Cryobacterium sp.]
MSRSETAGPAALPIHTSVLTSESVTGGHPDKVADQVSDAILDAHLALDPHARVACETLVTTGRVVVAGEITSRATIDTDAVVRQTIRDLGYDRPSEGFDADSCRVELLLHEQEPEIAAGVDTGGAGDQGMMFGYACAETPELMPLPIALAHRLTRRLTEARCAGEMPWLRPDGKSQVTVAYDAGRPRVTAVVVSTQHEASVSLAEVRRLVQRKVIDAVIPDSLRDRAMAVWVNPAGEFTHGGPATDTGLTGRKIIVDTYGGAAPHGGGAFSGKDATKVDRSAAYMARHIAKAVVAARLATRALVQLAYAIGVADPVSVLVDTLGSGRVSDQDLAEAVRSCFELTPRGIIASLELRRPIYRSTAAGGHFGRTENGFTWEHVDQAVARLRRELCVDGGLAGVAGVR